MREICQSILLRAILLAVVMVISACTHSDDDNGPILPGDGEDQTTFAGYQDERIVRPLPEDEPWMQVSPLTMANAVSGSVVWSGKSYGVRNGRQAWRVPKTINSRLSTVFLACFTGDQCYTGRKGKIARYRNGVFIGYPTSKRPISHGGVFLHSKYGHSGKQAMLANKR